MNKPSQHTGQRRIIHIDMDAFFASVEQRDNPNLQGKPVIVGGQPNSRGVVAACSYEAREYGVRSAMPCSQAAKLCPNAVYITPNIAKYRTVSQGIHTIFKRYTDRIEPLSLDEAYLDVTGADQPATSIAKAIKADIHQTLGLIASAGVSYNKFLAKLASDMDKPNGLYVIRPQHAEALVARLPVRQFHGIGPATETKMKALGIETGADLKAQSLAKLQKHFKRSAQYYYNLARAIDHREIKTARTRRSMGTETTFASDIQHEDQIHAVLLQLCQKLQQALSNKQLYAQTLTIKIKFADFTQVTRAKTIVPMVNFDSATLAPLLTTLMSSAALNGRAVRLLGVSASKLHTAPLDKPPKQLELYH